MTADVTLGLGGGCHWCTEAVFQRLPGVGPVEQGWITAQPPDDAWSEAVRLQYSPDAVSLDELLRVHLHTHSSTSAHAMRLKYRSAVYTTSSQQAEAVTAALQRLQGEFDAPLVTRVLPLVAFRPSETRYRDYYKRRPERPFCQTYIRPKLDMLDTLLGR